MKTCSEVDCKRLAVHLAERLGDELLAVYLYGSQALGEALADSDIDLAVLCRHPLPPERRLDLALELADLAGRDVDLVDLRRVPTVLQFQIVSRGRRLLCRDETACELFETHVWSDYVALNEARAGILEDIRRRGCIYG